MIYNFCRTLWMPIQCLPDRPSPCINGGSRNFETTGDGRQYVGPVVIYRKCALWTICLQYGKRRLTEKKIMRPIGAIAPTAPWIRSHCPL